MHRGRYAQLAGTQLTAGTSWEREARLVRQGKLACRKTQDAAKPARATSLARGDLEGCGPAVEDAVVRARLAARSGFSRIVG